MKKLNTIEQLWNDLKLENKESELIINTAEKTSQIIDKLIKARQELGLTQQQVAEKCGIKQSALARIETLNVIPKITTLIKIAEVLNVSIIAYNSHEKSQLQTITNFGTTAIKFAYNLKNYGGHNGYRIN